MKGRLRENGDIDCKDFVEVLRDGIMSNEIISRIRTHIRTCMACNSLLKSWIYNKEHGQIDLPSPEVCNMLRKKAQEELLTKIFGNETQKR